MKEVNFVQSRFDSLWDSESGRDLRYQDLGLRVFNIHTWFTLASCWIGKREEKIPNQNLSVRNNFDG